MFFDLRKHRPLDEAAIRAEGGAQFSALPSQQVLQRLAEILASDGRLALRVYGEADELGGLEFLRHFPTLRRFHAGPIYGDLSSFEALNYLPDALEMLELGATSKRLSLEPLHRFRRLRVLSLDGHSKDIEVLAKLTDVKDLTLRSITLPDLSLLLPMRRLRSFDLKLGGTHNLGLVPELGPLRYLELWKIRGLTDLTPAASVESLEYLYLQDLTQVTELPDMSKMISLRRVHIENLKRVTDITPLLTAPALKELIVYDRQFKSEDFEDFKEHPTLAAISLLTKRDSDTTREMLGLTVPRDEHDLARARRQ